MLCVRLALREPTRNRTVASLFSAAVAAVVEDQPRKAKRRGNVAKLFGALMTALGDGGRGGRGEGCAAV